MKNFLSSNTIINEIFPEEQKKKIEKFQQKGKSSTKTPLIGNIACHSQYEIKKFQRNS